MEQFAKIFNFDTILTKSRINFVTKTRTFNTKKAQEILAYKPIKLAEGIKKIIQWYQKHHYL